MQIRSELSIHQSDNLDDIRKKIDSELHDRTRTLIGFHPENNILIKSVNLTVVGKKKPRYIAVVIYNVFVHNGEVAKSYDRYKRLSKSKESVIEGTIKKVLEENPKTKIGFMKSLEKEGWVSGDRI